MDKCQDHMKLMVDIAEIKSDIKYIVKHFDENTKIMNNHLEESVLQKEIIHDNSRFTCNATKALWIVYASIVGIITKIVFLK